MKQFLRIAAVIAVAGWGADNFSLAQETPRRQESTSALLPMLQEATPNEEARLYAVRFVSFENYTRVVMETSQSVGYDIGSLPGDAAKGLPPRIYVNISGAKVDLESQEPIAVDDGLVKRIRVGQFTPETVRVVLDMTALRGHNAFTLSDPHRVVLDIQKVDAPVSSGALVKTKAPSRARKSSKPQTFGLRKIVLDPGHGGKDPGAIGVGGLAEKDVVLSVAKKLAAKIKKEMGIAVVLTRTDDRYVPLEERTAIANAENADLFISLHMNASPNSEAKGVETYYLDNTTDEASIRLAARENGTSRQEVSDLQFILSDMTQNMKLEDSVTLAHRLQGSLVTTLGGHMRDIKDLGVKRALFYVLVGARMPSVLLELFFITNRSESRAMSRSKFQDAVADALYDGIYKYNRSMLAAKTL